MNENISESGRNIVVIGGGTGSIALLQGLKDKVFVTSIVGMADDGGSNGVIRDELHVLPPSDVWKCMTALSSQPDRSELFRYRFSEGPFQGHTLGNMVMTAASKQNGFEYAVEIASSILEVQGSVVPVTLDDVRLQMQWPETGKTLIGEHIIDIEHFADDPRRAELSLLPVAQANPRAIAAIREADMIVFAPGDLYTTQAPQLVIAEFAQAIREAQATKVYVSNLVTKPGHTDGFSVADHASEIERFIGDEVLDFVVYNKQQPDNELRGKYHEAGSEMVEPRENEFQGKKYLAVPADLLGATVDHDASETLTTASRSFIRHDSQAVADAIIGLYDRLS
jgi:uncharacterized cofD-like protein